MQVQISLDNVGHGFQLNGKTVELFSGINAEFKGASSTAIIGPSGSGKSTMLAIMAGLDLPNNGRVVYHNKALVGSSKGELTATQIRQHTGFIFQHFHLLDEMDVLNNVALPLKLRGDRKAIEKSKQWLNIVGLSDRYNQPVTQLSGGEKQRVAIARAFVSEPAVIFADEPTGSLDEATAQDITQVMFDCCHSHSTNLVLVTHNNELAAQADECYSLSHGKLELQS